MLYSVTWSNKVKRKGKRGPKPNPYSARQIEARSRKVGDALSDARKKYIERFRLLLGNHIEPYGLQSDNRKRVTAPSWIEWRSEKKRGRQWKWTATVLRAVHRKREWEWSFRVELPSGENTVIKSVKSERSLLLARKKMEAILCEFCEAFADVTGL